MSLTADLKNDYLAGFPAAAADALEAMPESALGPTLSEVDTRHLTATLELVASGRALTIFRKLEAEQRLQVLTGASPRLSLLLLGGLAATERSRLLEQLPDGIRADLSDPPSRKDIPGTAPGRCGTT